MRGKSNGFAATKTKKLIQRVTRPWIETTYTKGLNNRMLTEEIKKQAQMLAQQIVLAIETGGVTKRVDNVKKLTDSFMDIFELGISEGLERARSQAKLVLHT